MLQQSNAKVCYGQQNNCPFSKEVQTQEPVHEFNYEESCKVSKICETKQQRSNQI